MSDDHGVVCAGDWKKLAQDLKFLKKDFKRVLAMFMKREVLRYRSMVVKGIKDQEPGGKRFRPLSAWTLAMRKFRGFGGTKALIVSGEMRKAITYRWSSSKLEGFAGILYKSKAKDGKSMVNIAAVHEFGTKPFAIKRTDKMRKFLAMVASRTGLIVYTPGHVSSGIYVVKIPARPFFGPTFEEWQKDLGERTMVFFKNEIEKRRSQ